MKKTVAMLVMLISAVLYAGEDENVKAVVVEDWQLAAQGRFAGCLIGGGEDCEYYEYYECCEYRGKEL